jgi:hypothetical protein
MFIGYGLLNYLLVSRFWCKGRDKKKRPNDLERFGNDLVMNW